MLLWLAIVVLGLIAVRAIPKHTNIGATSPRPSAARGDVSLTQRALPAQIDNWRQQRFVPPRPFDDLPDQQTWWSHAWHFRDVSTTAAVIFDQENWTSWHELTICYEAIGWEVVSHTVVDETDSSERWPNAVAHLRRGVEEAILVYSMFGADGAPVLPLEIDNNLVTRFRARYDEAVTSGRRDRKFQCQVFAVFPQDTASPMSEERLMRLHLASRELFRSAWLHR